MKHFILSALLVLALNGTCVTLYAQSSQSKEDLKVKLIGRVVDRSSNLPIFRAVVQLPQLKLGALTDSSGYYSISVPIGTYSITCSGIGYKPVSTMILLYEDQKVDFSLEPTPILKDEVLISTDKVKDKLLESSQSIEYLLKEELDAHRGQTFGEMLKELPGVSVFQTGVSISKPVIRGLHSQRILTINSGIRQEGQQWGAEHAPEIDPFSPYKIEVLKGAASVQYGADAIGGVIKIEPKALPNENTLEGEISLNAFSNNRQGALSGFLEGGFSNGIGWRVQSSIRKAGDASAPMYVLQNTGFQEQDFSVSAGIKRNFGHVNFHFSQFDTELGIFSSSHIGNTSDLLNAIRRGSPTIQPEFSYQIGLPKQNITHQLLSLHAEILLEKIGRLEFQYGWQHNHRREFDLHKGLRKATENDPPAYDLNLWTYNADLKYHHIPIRNFLGTIGFSGTAQYNVNRGSTYLIPNFEAYTGGVFVFEEFIKEDWTFNLGTRYDYRNQTAYTFPGSRFLKANNNREFQTLSVASGLVYRFISPLSIAINLSTAWRPPSINELHSYGVHHGTAQFEIGDSTLSVERSLNLDATFRFEIPTISAEVSVFHNTISNFIYLFPLSEPIISVRGAFPSFVYNQDDARFYGIDSRVQWHISKDIRLDATLSIVRASNLNSGEPIYLIPSDRLNLLAHLHFHDFSFLQENFFEISSALVRRQNRFPLPVQPESLPPIFPDEIAYRDYLNLIVAPPAGYALFGLAVGSTFVIGRSRFVVNLSVQNIFNTRYRDYMSRFRYYADDMGRNVVFRINTPFGNSSN